MLYSSLCYNRISIKQNENYFLQFYFMKLMINLHYTVSVFFQPLNLYKSFKWHIKYEFHSVLSTWKYQQHPLSACMDRKESSPQKLNILLIFINLMGILVYLYCFAFKSLSFITWNAMLYRNV